MHLHAAVHGHCYLAWQSLLVFGRDKGEPVTSRPVVSLLQEKYRLYVLPATRKPDDALYPIELRRCSVKDGNNKFRYSYLSPHPEVVTASKLKEIGILPEDLRQNIATWLRNRHLGAAL
jgi:hypothetical protein